MNHLGHTVPQSHIPPQMMGQAPRLMTTAPPVPVVNALSPLQIEMSPNTQMQQAIAAATVAAMTHGRPMVSQECKGRSFNNPSDPESRFTGREVHMSPELPVRSQHQQVKHSRRISESSSLASSGFISSGSPHTMPQSASPQKHSYSQNSYGMVSPHMSVSPPTFPGNATCRPSSTPRSYSPASSVSDSDSESLWRPW